MAERPKKTYARATNPMELPTLIDVQLNSFKTFKEEGLAELFEEISPIESFNKNLKLYFPSKQPEVDGFDLKFWFEEPKYNVDECVERDMSYAAPLYVKVMLYSADQDQPIVQDICFYTLTSLFCPGNSPKISRFYLTGSARHAISILVRQHPEWCTRHYALVRRDREVIQHAAKSLPVSPGKSG